jgi:hypothetical protein
MILLYYACTQSVYALVVVYVLTAFSAYVYYTALHCTNRCMNRLAKVCARYLGGQRGFSIGIDDVTPSTDLSKQKLSLLQVG